MYVCSKLFLVEYADDLMIWQDLKSAKGNLLLVVRHSEIIVTRLLKHLCVFRDTKVKHRRSSWLRAYNGHLTHNAFAYSLKEWQSLVMCSTYCYVTERTWLAFSKPCKYTVYSTYIHLHRAKARDCTDSSSPWVYRIVYCAPSVQTCM